QSLLQGDLVRSEFGADERVKKTLKACAGLQMQEFELFGRDRVVDFSQFKVRGHYENSELLGRYFKAMMWCGRIDLRIAGGVGSGSPATTTSPGSSCRAPSPCWGKSSCWTPGFCRRWFSTTSSGTARKCSAASPAAWTWRSRCWAMIRWCRS